MLDMASEMAEGSEEARQENYYYFLVSNVFEKENNETLVAVTSKIDSKNGTEDTELAEVTGKIIQ